MVYQILLVISIIFIILGVILSGVSVYIFRKRNMAEVYDSLLNRGYTERIEKYNNKKHKNKAVTNESLKLEKIESVQKIKSQAVNRTLPANSTVKYGNSKPRDSELTVPLNTFSNNGEGLTTILEAKVDNDNFKIIKELYYTFSNETI